MDQLADFFEKSPIAERITLPTRIILHRLELSPDTAAAAMEAGALEPPVEGQCCELEVGGQLIARGKLVRRRGAWCFRVDSTGEEER